MSDRHLFCPACEARIEAGCDCGGGYVPPSVFAGLMIARYPELSNRALADKAGVSEPTLRRARASNDAPDEKPNEINARVVGKDGKSYVAKSRMPKKKVVRPATPEEAGPYSPKAERHIDTRTGENISRTEAIKREAILDQESGVAELRAELAVTKVELAATKAEVENLQSQLRNTPSVHDMRRKDAINYFLQRLTTDIETYKLLERCLHPDNSASSETRHKAWLAFHALEAILYDKSKHPPPLPETLTDLWRMKEAGKEARKRNPIWVKEPARPNGGLGRSQTTIRGAS